MGHSESRQTHPAAASVIGSWLLYGQYTQILRQRLTTHWVSSTLVVSLKMEVGIVLSLFVSSAFAWDARPEGWTSQIQWCAEESLRADVEEAWSVWQSVADCAPIGVVQVEDCDEADVVFLPGDPNDGTDCMPNQSCEIRVPSPDFFDTTCPDENLRRYLTYTTGLALGLLQTCKDGDECADEASANALMHWASMSMCLPPVPTADDFEALSSLYGPGAVLNPPVDTLVVAVGEAVCFTAETTSPEVEVDFVWRMGDGTEVLGETACHSYETDLLTWVSLDTRYRTCDWERSHEQWQFVQVGDGAPLDPVGPSAEVDSGCSVTGSALGGLLGIVTGLLGAARRRRAR